MRISVIDKNKMCVLLSGGELKARHLEYKTMSCADAETRHFLCNIYRERAAGYGLSNSPQQLKIELYPFMDHGCMVIFSPSEKRRWRRASFFCRFCDADDLLDCLSKLGPLKSRVRSFTLYQMGDAYYAQVSAPQSVRSFLSEFSSEKCCQKKAFYLEYGRIISKEIFT